MKEVIIAAILLATIGSWVVVRARAKTSQRPTPAPPPKKNAEDAGRGLRQMMLTTPPGETGMKPTKEFPRVYGVLMDWPIDEVVATVFSGSTGAASLFGGVRVIDTDLASATDGTGKYAELFGLGQAVLTELRLVTKERQ